MIWVMGTLGDRRLFHLDDVERCLKKDVLLPTPVAYPGMEEQPSIRPVGEQSPLSTVQKLLQEACVSVDSEDGQERRFF
jgi:hypothetical protein